MTASQTDRPTLDDVLAQIAAAQNPPNAQDLRAWTSKYPEFAQEIIDFATDFVALDAERSARAVTEDVVTEDDVELVVNRTMSRIQTLLDEQDNSKPITDLPSAIRASGFDVETLQNAIDVDRSIMDCLISRLVAPATVPARLVRDLAVNLRRTTEQIRSYFRLPPQMAGAYKARNRPETRQVNFAMLVEHSQLPQEKKARWLAESPDPGLRE